MANGTFKLKWTDEGRKYEKEVNKQTFQILMEGIREQFVDNNEVSTKFVKIIPEIDSLIINKGRNRDEDIPKVFYTIGEKTDSISISRNHIIIWNILNECCKL